MDTNNNNLSTINTWNDLNDDLDIFSKLDDVSPDDDADLDIDKSDDEPQNQNEPDTLKDDDNDDTKDDTKDVDAFDNIDDDVDKDDIKDTSNLPVRDMYSYLINNGIIDEDDESDEFDFENASEEDIEYRITDKLDKAVDDSVKSILNDLPDFVKDLNKFVLNGGDYNQFINQYSNNNTLNDFDIDDVDDQKYIISQSLKQRGYDDEYIETQLEFLQDSGKLKSIATKEYDLFKKEQEQTQKQLLEQQEQQKQQLIKQERENRKLLLEKISKVDNIGDLSVSKIDKRSLPSYISERNVKLTNGSYITGLQKELFYDVFNNEDAMLQLAILVKNRNSDGTFNFDSIKRKAETNVTKNVKNNIRRNTQGIPKGNESRRTTVRKSLADYFD